MKLKGSASLAADLELVLRLTQGECDCLIKTNSIAMACNGCRCDLIYLPTAKC